MDQTSSPLSLSSIQELSSVFASSSTSNLETSSPSSSDSVLSIALKSLERGIIDNKNVYQNDPNSAMEGQPSQLFSYSTPRSNLISIFDFLSSNLTGEQLEGYLTDNPDDLTSASSASSVYNLTSETESYENFLNSSRFWVQKILVPLIMIIGVIGNSITIVIMTRRRMRSSTNTYLAALATFDMLYLIFTFILSLEHYPAISEDSAYYYYWKFYPFSLMITDCCSNSSVWLTVTFTIERYIVVSHPIKGKVICTESRARKVVFAVFLICFTMTIPTPFEWNIVEQIQEGNKTFYTADPSDLGKNRLYKTIFYGTTAVLFVFLPLLLLAIFNSFLIRSVHLSRKQRSLMTSGASRATSGCSSISKTNCSTRKETKKNTQMFSFKTFLKSKKQNKNENPDESTRDQLQSRKSELLLTSSSSPIASTPRVNRSAKGLNSHLSVTPVLPKKQTGPSGMTTIEGSTAPSISSTNVQQCDSDCSPNSSCTLNANFNDIEAATPLKQEKTKQQNQRKQTESTSTNVKQETKITVMLIAVVILFIVCQLPTAVLLVYTSVHSVTPKTKEFYLTRILGNIFNFLMAINSAGNFVLYCLLSQKYRRTFIKIFCPCVQEKCLNDEHSQRETRFYDMYLY